MIKRSVLAAAMSFVAFVSFPTTAQEKVTFAYIEEPPFAATIDGQPAGSDVDVARAVLARMGIKDVDVRKVEFAELLPGVASGKWTMNTDCLSLLSVAGPWRIPTPSGRWSMA